MERHKLTSATISTDALWPASTCAAPAGNLSEALGTLIHANEIKVVWEKPELAPDPYNPGRQATFAGKIVAKSDLGPREFAIGALAASYIGAVVNQLPANGRKGVTA